MYVRIKAVETTTLGDHARRYRCVHCGYETTARAFAFARGLGLSPYGIDDAGAERRAGMYARAAAGAQASLAIRIAPCPRCHRRDRRAIVRVYRSALIISLALLALPVVLVAWSGQRLGAALFVGIALGFVPAMLYWKHRTSQLTSRHVRFDPPAEPPAT